MSAFEFRLFRSLFYSISLLPWFLGLAPSLGELTFCVDSDSAASPSPVCYPLVPGVPPGFRLKLSSSIPCTMTSPQLPGPACEEFLSLFRIAVFGFLRKLFGAV